VVLNTSISEGESNALLEVVFIFHCDARLIMTLLLLFCGRT